MRIALFHLLVLIACAVPAYSGDLQIIVKPVAKGFSPGRKAGDSVDTIVVHFSSNVIAAPANPYDVDSVIALFTQYNASAHYLIDRGGKIYRLVEEKDTAFHAGAGVWKNRTNDLNRTSIGIELMAIGTAEEMQRTFQMPQEDYAKIPKKYLGYTQEQYKALSALIKDIEARNPAIKHDRDHVIGHDEYAKGRKCDPGALFDWKQIGL